MRHLGELQHANRFTDDQLVRFLNASVAGVPTLRNVLHINKATRKAAGNRNEITFDEYVALLLDQASVDDVAAGYKKNPRSRVNVHKMVYDDENQEGVSTYKGNVHEVYEHDMDTPAAELLACQA